MATLTATPTERHTVDYDIDYWKQYKTSGRKRATYIGLSRNASKPVTIKSVSVEGVRVVFADDIEPVRVHPDDIRPA